MPSETASAGPQSTTAWLRVAFWKKPLHLLVDEDVPGHGHAPGSGSGSGDAASPSGSGRREMERTLELFDLIMIGIGGTVGAGVFATAGLIASAYAGPGAILSWLIAGLGCILSGFSFMELSCLIPSAGSTYAYAYHALGELPAMFAGFLLTLEYGISSAGGARSWSDKFTTWLETEWQITGPEWMKPADSTMDLYAGLLMTLCVSVVLLGMQAGKVLVNVVTMTKISVVVFIILVGLARFNADNVTPFLPEAATNSAGQLVYGWPGVFLGASASFFGYIGYDEVCCLAGEAKNPTHNIPRAVIGTIVGAAVLSTLATLSLVGMQRYSDIDTAESYGRAFEHVGWPWAATVVATGEVVTMPITTLIGFLAQPRVQYAMARDGLLPAVFAQVDDTGNLFRGTLLCGIAVILIATFVPFQILWNFISLGILVAFNLTNASLLLVRAARLRDGANGEARERTHSVLIVVFLVTSFLAAFHWQKSVIAPAPPAADPRHETYAAHYMRHLGPVVASACSLLAFAAMCALKYVEVAAAAPPSRKSTRLSHKRKTSGAGLSHEIHLSAFARTVDGSGVAMHRLPTSADEAEDESDADSTPRSDAALELELGRDADCTKSEADSTDADTASCATTSSSASLRRGIRSAAAGSTVDGVSTAGLKANARPELASESTAEEPESATFQAPLVPFTPCVAIFFNWFLFAQMDASSVVLIALWMLLALAVYVGYSAHHSLARQQLRYHRVETS
ncbi:hypothetical protein P43SY_000131 [Pythium insidiosum]|uniref:Cationic amino acid transporter C-terminal domain-containing protein n=1 Tax=Pythium insidiosum TaxID=114742 RepID=A0AAD5M1E9_PYTIN|nr:hypothetical protein P43SY_000131 [Pythium insidiosum]